ncbi:MAG: FG-GAP-like repeat-containing protein [Pyrinomonadaceae bacterium]|nr:FG-GAP-like repeat-containing protein [Pyrinomonadaceae bacterium]
MSTRKRNTYSHIVSRTALGLITLLAVAVPTLAQSFGAPVQYPVGSHPYAASLSDFNGDGKLDLAVANNSSNDVSVLLGNGDSAFGTKTDYTVGAGAYGIVVTDLNGDGKLDIATANTFSLTANVSILLGNGNGTFQSKVDYPFQGAAQPNSISSADFNGDGKSDLVAVNGSGATVFLGSGDGTLGSPANYGSSNFATSVAVGDFNGDGKLDLGVSSYGISGLVSVMLGNGNGTFLAPVDYPAGPSPFAIAAADFNADGKLDLATANIQVSSISVLLGNGNGTFQPAANYFAGGSPYGIAVADFNSDGKSDVLSAGNGGGLNILKGNGDGTFRSPINFQTGGVFATVRDLNGDSKPDLVTVAQANSISVLLNQTGPYNISGVVRDTNGAAMSGVGISLTGGAPEFTTTDSNGAYTFLDLANGGNFTVTPFKTNYSFAPSTLNVMNLSSNVTGDFTGTLLNYSISGTVRDTFGNPMSGVTITLTGSQSNVVTTASDGRYSFTNLPGGGNYTVTPSLAGFLFSPPGSTINNLSSNRIASFTGARATYTISGVVTDVGNGSSIENLTVLLSGTKYATAVTNFSSGYSFSGLPADGDYTVTAYSSGANGLFTSVLMLAPVSRTFNALSGNVTANFSARRLIFGVSSLNPEGIAQGDLNGDGKLDLAVATTTGSNIHVLIGNGDGTFQTSVPYVAGPNPPDVVIADFNADGKLDVASANSGSTVSIFIGNGDGTLRPAVNYPVGSAAATLTASDLNGDGKIDLAVLVTGNTLNVLLGNGDGTFNAAISKAVPTAVFSISAGDLNADNKADLVLLGFPNSALVLLGNGNGTFADAVAYPAGTDVRKAVIADVNADGKLDLAVADDRAFTILLGNGDGTFRSGTPTNLQTNTSDIISGDFDGDAKLDLAITNYFGGISFLSGNGDGTFNSAVGYPAGLYSRSLVGGDFNNDGQQDLATTNGDDIWMLLNTTLSRAPALQFSSASYDVDESAGSAVVTVTRTSPTSTAARVVYTTVDNSSAVNCNVLSSQASSRCDYETKVGTLLFAPGETSKTISIPIINDSYAESAERFLIILSNESGVNLGPRSAASININDNDSANGPNPIDQAEFFVRQHYIEFLNREPDASGLAFWSNQITECQQPGATCDAEVRRINVSAAFFLSIEFQETGYLVYRMYRASYGDVPGTPVPVRLDELLPDTQQIGEGVIVGALNWQIQLENNKAAFALDFVSRPRFAAKYGATLTPAQFVDALYAQAGVVSPSVPERAAAINEFGGAGNTGDIAARGRALRRVAENSTLAQQETNRAFVLMQYFGYLRRNPNDAPEPGLNFDGYNFWLGKLIQFGGNFVNAEMVKAFIVSGEYRQRFGP